jgi:hypothetical protein
MTPYSRVLSACAFLAFGSSAEASTKPFENAELGYRIALPVVCRHQQGPGTLEAICATDLDAAKSQDIQAAAAIVLEVDGEITPPEAKPFEIADFRMELPEAICGEADANKVKLSNVREAKDAGVITYTADVTCPEMKFLGLPERRAEARTVIAGKYRYRLMARYPSADIDMAKPLAKAFYDSFQLQPTR